MIVMLSTHGQHRTCTNRAAGGQLSKHQATTARRSGSRSSRLNCLASSQKYDYIIVGGGTAGCVLANKLTADGTKQVLVLEAGGNGENDPVVRVPAGLTRLFRNPVLDWGIFSQFQPQLKAREIYLARGRTLGGSSCTNATLYLRGTPQDYDSWGLEGWGSKDVMDWFMKAENYANGPAPYHGTSGAMSVEQPRYDNPLHEEFFRAAAALGLKANPDFNNWDLPQEGYGEFQVAQKQGERADMFKMYLKPAMQRGNLKVLTGAKTTKVQFEKTSKGARAKGVEYSTTGPLGRRETVELAAGGEVIMAAGTVHNPQILMLSGIGPAKALREFEVDVLLDNAAVGANLQDHPATLWAARSKPQYDELAVTSEIYDSNYNIKLGAIFQYLVGRKGPLATTGCDHGAFISTTGKGEPDLQMRFVPAFALDPDALNSYVRFGELKKEKLKWPGGVTVQLLAVRPKSVGSIGLKSADPFTQPAININYFTDPTGADMATLKAGIRMCRELGQTTPLAKYIEREDHPGIDVDSDAAVEDYVRRTVCSGNALTGTCSMGAPGRPGTVVSSSDLKVVGVEGIRIADASVVPRIPGGQTGAVTVMIAERLAAQLTGAASIGGGSASSRMPVAA